MTGNPEHLMTLKKEVATWNEWRKHNIKIRPDLYGTDLGDACLSNSNLSSPHENSLERSLSFNKLCLDTRAHHRSPAATVLSNIKLEPKNRKYICTATAGPSPSP